MTDELIGKTIGGYEIISRIGEGGMATVYLALQQSMNRQVAMKVLPRHYLNDDTYLQRFEREVAIVSKLEHRNIIPVYDYGEYVGQPYIVMRYMPAGSVDDLLRQGALSPEQILTLVSQIAPALDYAHSKDVLHRDLKPSNVLLDDDGGAFLTDFGIARVVSDQNPGITTQGVVGTPSYMSPEQAQGKALDGRSDVYALGVMLFEMATGRRPFESDTAYSIAVMQVTTPPPAPRSYNPQISVAMEKVILKALRKDREERYPTAAALLDAIRTAIERPHLIHDTQPSLPRADLSGYQAPAQNGMQPSAAQMPAYQAPVNRPLTVPPGSMRPVAPRRKPNALLSALIGGTIGCGLLGILLVVGLIIVSLIFPNLPAGMPAATESSGEIPDTTAISSVTALASDSGSATPTLDPTSETARQTLIARSTTTATESAATPAPDVMPIGVRGTPTLRDALRDVGGTLILADIRGESSTLELVSINLTTWIETQLTLLAGANSSYPLPSPDGRWIAFQSERDGDFEIYLVNRGGGQLTQLTNNAITDRLPAWSPDGEWIIYSADVRGDETFDLRRVRVDGSADELVFSNLQRNSHARYSPDGRYIVFTTGADPRSALTWEIALLDTVSGEYRLLTDNTVRDASPLFSPDGSTILYVTHSPQTDSNALSTMDLNGDNRRILYDTTASEWAASYSPDGRYIVFTSNISGGDQLYLMTLDASTVQQITSSGGLYASWIPDQSE
jgi:tRNA A-37 threonylcarbamoyl transferase component Bud32/WD40 repeat protein